MSTQSTFSDMKEDKQQKRCQESKSYAESTGPGEGRHTLRIHPKAAARFEDAVAIPRQLMGASSRRGPATALVSGKKAAAGTQEKSSGAHNDDKTAGAMANSKMTSPLQGVSRLAGDDGESSSAL